MHADIAAGQLQVLVLTQCFCHGDLERVINGLKGTCSGAHNKGTQMMQPRVHLSCLLGNRKAAAYPSS